MKKKLALLLAATMIVGMMPFSAFAGSDNRTNTTVTAVRDEYNQRASIVIENDDKDWNWVNSATASNLKFELDLNGAEWFVPVGSDHSSDEADIQTWLGSNIKFEVGGTVVTGVGSGSPVEKLTVEKLTASKITLEMKRSDTSYTGEEVTKMTIPLPVQFTDDGDATVTVDRLESFLSNGTYTFGTVTSESTSTTTEGIKDVPESGKELKVITIAENVRGSLDLQSTIDYGVYEKGGILKLKLSSNFKFVENNKAGKDGTKLEPKLVDASGSIQYLGYKFNDESEVWLYITDNAGSNSARTAKSKLVISGLYVMPDDDTSPNDTATMTISGAGIDKAKIEVAKYVDYGYEWEAEDKDLPVLYCGTNDETDNDTLKVYFNETVKGSWLRGRKTEITFPEEVKVNSIDVKKAKNADGLKGASDNAFLIDGNKVTILANAAGGGTDPDKAECEFVFNVSIEAGFTGDIEATIGGSGVTTEMSTVVAKAEMPFTVETVKNEVKIDYRNVAINDIIIKEAYAGALEKDKYLRLAVEEMQFEKGLTAEVTEGDLTIKKIETDKDGNIDIKIDKESVKSPGTIKISNLQLYLQRSLPAGDYRLSAVPYDKDNAATDPASISDAFFKNYLKNVITDTKEHGDKNIDSTKFFDKDEVVLVPDFVSVVTAPRDQDDSTFTTKLSVVIGAKEMQVGDKTIPLAVPAYISAEGYTMLPVRAVTEALSGAAIVNWDNETRQVTIIFGSRIISMTIDSNIMTINGTQVPMSAKAVITDDYTFLPLRDLGYALGLSDDKIKWDAATKTATLN